ncbi:glycosyltransferase family 2 protein [Guptibacillus algicola]|uniref:glycosyltransferase family 2 protein n=1 Tax=Guptibacillus algicola TaxID=225844 RepID=UPI001CD1D5F1|nr:glycosyltransferase family 2 protein [Alkalihalobacillus algicola]MCA0987055.1 glycosyltransferase [Alkalihalobacillus algicola]
MKVNVSIIIVNWNTKDLLIQCLDSIYKTCGSVDFDVHVVDNNSEDGSVGAVLEQYPDVILYNPKKNLGFAKANNHAIRNSDSNFVFLLNPDTILFEQTLYKMVEYINDSKNKNVAAIGCKLLNTDYSTQASCRKFPTVLSYSFITLKLHHVFPNFKHYKEYLMDDFDYKQVKNVDQIMGACMLIRREVISELNGFDENFWIWFEEVDLCKRIKEKGWDIHFYPFSEMIHYQGQSFNKLLTLNRQKIFNKSMIQYFSKHHSKIAVKLLKAISGLGILLSFCINQYRYIFKRDHNIKKV